MMVTKSDVQQIKPPQISGIAYGGGQMKLPGWTLPVVVGLPGMEVPQMIPLLTDHENRTGAKIGEVRALKQDNCLLIEGRVFPTSEEAREVLEQARAGGQWQLSIGCEALEVEHVPAGKEVTINGQVQRGPFNWIKKSRLREVSVVAVGADAGTECRIAASFNITKEGLSMANETTNTDVVQDVRAPAAAKAAEEARLCMVDQVCAAYAGEFNPASGRPLADIKASAIKEGWDQQALELALLYGRMPRPPKALATRPSDSRDVLAAAVLVKAGYGQFAANQFGADVAQQAEQAFAHGHALDIVEVALQRAGLQVPSSRQEMIQAAFSTNVLSGILGVAGERVLLDAYRRATAAWRGFAQVRPVKNFRAHTALRPSLLRGVEQVASGGELKHVVLDGSKYDFSIDTYGAVLSIDRQDLINDDLGAYAQAAAEMGKSCGRKINDLVAQVLLSASAELTTGSSALGTESLGAAVALLRNRVDAAGDSLDIQPAVLLVPPALEATGRSLLESMEIAAAEGEPTGHAWKGVAALGVEPRLSNLKFSGYSTTVWFLLGAPEDAPVIVAFLNGNELPTFEQMGVESTVDRLAFTWRVYHDFGAALGDTNALVKSAGE